MRRLVHIPIIHSATDLGGLADSVKAHYSRFVGEHAWERREQLVEAFWKEVRKRVETLYPEADRWRVYQDGLPVCGFEEKIVRELAEAGSWNHELIVELLDRGAALEGTEDPRLLMEEYEMHRNRVAGGQIGSADDSERAAQLLRERDAAICRRIDETLQSGEVGLVLLGALHRLDALQSTDIAVESLPGSPSRIP